MDRHQRLQILTESATGDRGAQAAGQDALHRRRGGDSQRAGPRPRHHDPDAGDADQCLLALLRLLPDILRGQGQAHGPGPEEVARTFMEANRAGLAEGALPHVRRARTSRAGDGPDARRGAYPPAAGGVHRLRPPQGPAGRSGRSGARGHAAVRSRLHQPEGPRADVVRRLAKEKDLDGDLHPQSSSWPGRLSREGRLEGRPDRPAPMGTTTQFVVGAQGERDREILGLWAASRARVCCTTRTSSAFQPVAGTPMGGPGSHARRARVPALSKRSTCCGSTASAFDEARLRGGRQSLARARSQDAPGPWRTRPSTPWK